MSAPEKLNAGEPFRVKAGTWNELVDVADERRAARLGGPGPVPLAALRPACVAWVLNDTGADRVAGDVMELGASEVDVGDAPRLVNVTPTFAGTTPNSTADPVGVLLDDVPDGEYGRAAVQGVCLAKVNVTNTGHKYAAPTASQVYLTSSNTFGPVALLGTPGSTGTQVFPVLVGWLPPTSLVTVLTDVGCVGGVLTLTTQQVRVLDP